MIKKLLLLPILFATSLALALPQQPQNGGTGVSNDPTDTISLGGAVNTSGSFSTLGGNALTFTTTGSTNITLPTTGTIPTLSQVLQPVNNLADVSNEVNSRANIGIGTGTLVLNVDQNYVLTNPPYKNVYIDIPTSGRTVDLWPAGLVGGLEEGEQVVIKSSANTTNTIIRNSAGVTIFNLAPNQTFIVEYLGTTLAPPSGWYARQISGSGASQTMQQTYDAGSLVAMNESQPVVFSTGSTLPGSQTDLIGKYAFNPDNTGHPSAVYGMEFLMTKNGSITSLCYADGLFSSGTREVGLWQYVSDTSGILLNDVSVAKTDPLDPQTGAYRCQAITPIVVTSGERLVVAALTPESPPNERLNFYQTPNPDFAILDGVSYPETDSATLVYPQILLYTTGNSTAWGGANLIFQATVGSASSVSINDPLTSSSILSVKSVTQSSAPAPEMTTAQRNAIISPMPGSLIYNSDTFGFDYFDATDWRSLSSPTGPAGEDLAGFYPDPTVVAINSVPLGDTTATAGNILIGSGSFWVTNPITGDITLNSTGVTAIGAGKVTNTMLAGSIDDSKLNTISTVGKVANSATTATNANTASAIVARDGSGNFTAGTITTNRQVLTNGGAALTGTNNVLNFSSAISVGNYINLAAFGNIGVNGSGIPFLSGNLDWDATAATYKYMSNNSSGLVEVGSSGVLLKSAPSGTAGNSVTPSTILRAAQDGSLSFPLLTASRLLALDGSSIVTTTTSGLSPTFTGLNLSGLTASTLVATDGSKNLTSSVSGLSPGFTGLNLSGLTASSLVATDGSKNLTSSVSGLSPTFTGLNLSGLTASSIVTTDGSKNLATVSNPQTYTPTIGDGTNNFTTSTATGQYYQLGHLYIVTARLVWTDKGSASSGSNLKVSLPVALGANCIRAAVTLGSQSGISFTGSTILANAITGDSFFTPFGFSNTGVGTAVTVSQASASGAIHFTVTYWDN